ncbi:virulence-associated protein E [Bradyrhizobium sp. UFLA03-84]|uniref:DUF7146 domain-containing protein n=1 Tax=Bradyrhizobium sp. UFLA03-84 TaxID=418599 RepID=UPI000BADE223|nr:toprim domain-containing protein [Bradyrhizobium sp. UFLA03-84]PAY07166.1 virulence-associated protein E [Bradyrhizobium sp. UFLA03-84]
MTALDPRQIAKIMGGDVIGRDAVNVPGPGHSKTDRSLSIKIGSKYPAGFVVFSHAGDDPIECRDFVRDALGLGSFRGEQEQERRRAPLSVVVNTGASIVNDKNKDWALQIWQQSVDPVGTIVEGYLRNERGLELGTDIAGRVVRFHGSLKYDQFRRLPGMVCLMRSILSDEPVAIHRTFLDRDTGAKVDRKMLGPAKGAAIKIDPHASLDGRLTIGEGFETTHAARHAGFKPAWALGSAGAIGAFPVLRGITQLTLLKEIDPTSDLKTNECAKRYLRARRHVKVITPNVGTDFNDVWKASQR